MFLAGCLRCIKLNDCEGQKWILPFLISETALIEKPSYQRNLTRRLLVNSRQSCCRLRVVPHLSSGIVERAKRERAWKSPHARKGDTRRGESKKYKECCWMLPYLKYQLNWITRTNSVSWQVPYVCAQPHQPGSGSHGQPSSLGKKNQRTNWLPGLLV